MPLHDDSKLAFERPINRRSVRRASLGLAAAVRRVCVSPALEGREAMSVGRQWARRLGLLLAASMVVQVPALVGVGVSGARAAPPTPSYQATLSIDGNCGATVTVTWNNNTKLQSVQFYVRDLVTQETAPPRGTAPNEPVSGRNGKLSHSFQLQPLLTTSKVTQHSFDAWVNLFYNGNSSSLSSQIYNTNKSQDAPCYLGQPL
jgi:hypothetical protein